MTFALVGFGGMLGALARYGAGRALRQLHRTAFPFATLAVNISGAFLLGLLHAIGPAGSTTAFLGDGFLCSYTTFSAFMWEGFVLFNGRRHLNAGIYIATTLILGIAAYAGAYFL